MAVGIDVYVPDGASIDRALERTTDLAVGAHQDDLEGMAISAIAECYDSRERWFTGIVCADGAGSPRSGPYAGTADSEMIAIRQREQREAADIGRYGAIVQLGYASAAIRRGDDALVRDLEDFLRRAGAATVFTHNLADKHPTHVGVGLAVMAALRLLPPDARPDRLYGCEAWRSLDWLADDDRVELPSRGSEKLALELLEVFDSQISGGKRYDLAMLGRRRANATLSSPHEVDTEDQLSLAMDLTPLIVDEALDPVDFVLTKVDRLRDEIVDLVRGPDPT